MKANELRIGNWVYFNGNLENIDLDSFHGIATYDCFDSYKPIPLTEEWLEKFGFEEHGNYFEKSIFRVFTTFRGFYLFIGESYEYGTIDYVHQLQNIYFALKDEELTIK